MYATVPKGIVGNGSSPLLDRSSRCFSVIEGDCADMRIHAFSSHVAETREPQSSNDKLSPTVIPFSRTLLLFCRTIFVETAVYQSVRLSVTNFRCLSHLYSSAGWGQAPNLDYLIAFSISSQSVPHALKDFTSLRKIYKMASLGTSHIP